MTVEFANAEAAEAFIQSAALVAEIAEEYPWSETAKDALKAMQTAREGINIHGQHIR